MVLDYVASLFLTGRPKACAGETAQVVVTWFCRHLNYFLELARVIQRKWYRFTVEGIRYTEEAWARTSAPFVPQDKHAVSGLRPEAFLNDKAESLRGRFSASGTGLVLQTFRFTETRAGNAAQAVSGLRPESFLDDKAKSLRG
jgi:hypothetical protein